MKALVWAYVIDRPSLAMIQHGQRRVVRELFMIFMEAATNRRDWRLFPASIRAQLELLEGDGDPTEHARLVVDLIASMTEEMATAVHGRLTGGAVGTIVDSAGRASY